MPDQRRPRPSDSPRPERKTAGDRQARGGAGRGEVPKPYRPARKPGPRRPDLPEERPFVPREAWRDLRATVPAASVDDVVKAVGGAAAALQDGDTDQAISLLQWAKSVAPRTATIREALGVALYAAERYGEAQSELLAYRRLSGSPDQNHLLADCARALGKPEKVQPYVEDMVAAGVDAERIAEGMIVLAGERADRGDLEGALDAIRRVDLHPTQIQPWHPRVWYMAGDLSERLGRTDEARDFFLAISAVDEDFGDVEQRLAALG